MFCSNCGKKIDDKAVVCIHCGCAVGNYGQAANNQGNITIVNSNTMNGATARNRSWLVALILAIFGGVLGLHRFYTGYFGIGILQLISLGGLGIWWLIDIIAMVLHCYECADGGKLV